jgi:hypothetical protein
MLSFIARVLAAWFVVGGVAALALGAFIHARKELEDENEASPWRLASAHENSDYLIPSIAARRISPERRNARQWPQIQDRRGESLSDWHL